MNTRHLAALLTAAAVALPTAASADPSNASFAYSNGPPGSATLLVNGTVTLTATNRGWITQTGVNNGGLAAGNYIVGKCGSSDVCNGDNLLRNNYFRFDLAGIDRITSAVLNLAQPSPNGYISTAPSLNYVLYDYLGAGPINSAAGTGAFADLGTGVSFGSVVVTASSIGSTVGVGFNAAGLAALNAAQGGGFAFGGTIGAPGTVPEPASWALMIGGFGAVGGTLRRRRTHARVRFV